MSITCHIVSRIIVAIQQHAKNNIYLHKLLYQNIAAQLQTIL